MKFNKHQHQKVKYGGQLYAVLLEEFPDYHTISENSEIVIHPIANDWIVRITNPEVRKHMIVKKSNAEMVDSAIME